MPGRSGKFRTLLWTRSMTALSFAFGGAGRMRRFAPDALGARVYTSAHATPAQRGRLRSPSTCAAYSTMGTILP
jgi:hypothetical protein